MAERTKGKLKVGGEGFTCTIIPADCKEYPADQAIAYTLLRRDRGIEVAEANAAHFVLCWNSHEALVESLRSSRDALSHDKPNSCWSTGPMTGDEIEDLIVCPGCRALRKIEAALKLAEES